MICHCGEEGGGEEDATAGHGAGEGYKLVMAAVTAAQPKEAVGQDAAFEEGVELVLHELRQIGSGGASVWAMKVTACCCTRRYSVVCSGR